MSKFKAVIFDMDGTLIDAQEWHYRALNEALAIFGEKISRAEHETVLDGLPTRVKIEYLVEKGRLSHHLGGIVSAIKQDRTNREISKNCFPRVEQLLMFTWLKKHGFKVAVATNSIRASAEIMLKSAGIYHYLDALVTNEDVQNAKPAPDIFITTASHLGLAPADCLVFEDHEYGIKAAISAGCKAVQVDSVNDINTSLIQKWVAV